MSGSTTGYELIYRSGFLSELKQFLKDQVDGQVSIVVARSDTAASWLARQLAREGMPVVWHPDLGDKRTLLDLMVSRVPGIYIGGPGILVNPWISVDKVYAFDVDDTFLVLQHGGRYYEVHSFGVLTTFARAFDVPLGWVSPLPLLAVYLSGKGKGDTQPESEISYVTVPKQGVFAEDTIGVISDVISSGGRVLVVVGRTGYRTVRLCEQCGYVQRCPVCNGVMVYHAKENMMVCHRCGHREEPLLVCPVCGSLDFKMLGVGVELVEAELVHRFGSDNVASVSGSKKDYVRKVSKAPIVVATQALFGNRYPYFNFELAVLVSIDHLWALGKFDVLERAVRFVRRLAYLSKKVVIQTVTSGEIS